MSLYTVIVVSHQDFRAHENSNELINIQDFPSWRQNHHECKFKLEGDQSMDSQMRRAVTEHARTYCDVYGLDPETPLDIYPFAGFHDVYRPSKTVWSPDPNCNQFIFVSPSSLSHGQESLIFIKFHDQSSSQLRYCGTLGFLDHEIFSARIPHFRQLCDVQDNTNIILVEISSQTCYCRIDISNTFKQEDLRMGSIVVAQVGIIKGPISKALHSNLKYPPYGKHITSSSITAASTTGGKLYEQALDNTYTDMIFISEQEMSGKGQFRLAAHKNVLATVPYFKAAFESGMKESKGNEFDPVEFTTPPNSTKRGMNQFLCFVYRRDSLLMNYTIESLCELIRIADYYGFEELTQAAAAAIEAKYSWLSEGNVTELLRTIDGLLFPEKPVLVKLAVDYIVCNFSRVGRTPGFVSLFGKEVYNSIVDAVSNASSEKASGTTDT